MDWLEEKWKKKLLFIGMSTTDATLLARIKAKMERDTSFVQRIREEGFSGFCRWVEINCKDIYYAVKKTLSNLWDWVSGWL